jgi:transcriptional regulator with XRE-family HTH domain
MTLGELLRSTREARNVTQRSIAELIGVSQQYVSDVECGRRKKIGDVRRLLKWAAYLGIGNAQLIKTYDESYLD